MFVSKQVINMLVKGEDGNSWVLLVVYVSIVECQCENFWNVYVNFIQVQLLLWVIVGDFNYVVNLDDRKGGSNLFSWYFYKFVEWVDCCEFIDMGWVGFCFIWLDFWEIGMRLLERLDRVYCNSDWRLKYLLVGVYYLIYMFLDYFFIFFDMSCN